MKKETKQTKQKEKTMVISKSEYEQLIKKIDCYINAYQDQHNEVRILRSAIERHNSKWYNRKIKY